MAKKYDPNSGALGGLIAGIIMSVAGLALLSPVLLVIGIVVTVQNRGVFAGKTEKPAQYRSAPSKLSDPRRTDGVSYRSHARDHYHITNAGLSVERRLEQLEVMRDAGLLDKEEYEQRLQKILRNK